MSWQVGLAVTGEVVWSDGALRADADRYDKTVEWDFQGTVKIILQQRVTTGESEEITEGVL